MVILCNPADLGTRQELHFQFVLHPMSIGPGTGPEGPQELESHADRGVSLSLVHLPPGVRLLPYRSNGEDGRLQPSAPTGYGETTHIRMAVVRCAAQ